GPAGNVALAAAFSLAQEMKDDEIIIVQETEYTSAGKHHQAQLAFARSNGIDIYFGNPNEEVAGKSIILPSRIGLIKAVDLDLVKIKQSAIKNHVKNWQKLTANDFAFLIAETNSTPDFVRQTLREQNVGWEE
ncbi:MAG: hypothetical protein PHQ30_03890, partial [Candidatus Izemoplasmatales bacterium]|nr:hypothetical protein [Candidatus Izemoplasmatales bacterium]